MTVVLLLAAAALLAGLGFCAGWRLGWTAGRDHAEVSMALLLRSTETAR